MKYKGKQLYGPSVEVVVLPRQDGDIVIKVAAISDYDDFNKLAPFPIPPKKLLPGGVTQVNPQDPEYRKKLEDWAELKTHWMILTSLKASPDLEFETVKIEDTKTWKNYIEEFATSGFTPMEVNRIIQAIMSVNGLNDEKIEKATKAFLAGQVVVGK